MTYNVICFAYKYDKYVQTKTMKMQYKKWDCTTVYSVYVYITPQIITDIILYGTQNKAIGSNIILCNFGDCRC